MKFAESAFEVVALEQHDSDTVQIIAQTEGQYEGTVDSITLVIPMRGVVPRIGDHLRVTVSY